MHELLCLIVLTHATNIFHILARCPAFKRIFKENNVAESEVAYNRLTNGISARTMDILVHYLYKGKLLEMTKKDGVETLEQLLVTADKVSLLYNINHLIQQ